MEQVMEYLFDTNAVINFICDTGDFSSLRETDKFYLSFISFIELSVGYKTEDEERITGIFIDKSCLILINKQIIDKTIDIRKKSGLKLPDSIIAATAIINNLILITSDNNLVKIASDMEMKIYDPLTGKKPL